MVHHYDFDISVGDIGLSIRDLRSVDCDGISTYEYMGGMFGWGIGTFIRKSDID